MWLNGDQCEHKWPSKIVSLPKNLICDCGSWGHRGIDAMMHDRDFVIRRPIESVEIVFLSLTGRNDVANHFRALWRCEIEHSPIAR